MSDDRFSKLDAVFDEVRAKQEAEHAAAKERQRAATARTQKFTELMRSQALPAFEDLRQYLSGKGATGEIDVAQDNREFVFIYKPKGAPNQLHKNNLPRFSVKLDPGGEDRMRWEFHSMGVPDSSSTPRWGVVPLDQVDGEYIRTKLIELIERVHNRS